MLSLFFLLRYDESCSINCNKCAFRVVWGSYILFKIPLPNLLKLVKIVLSLKKSTSVLYNMHFKSVTSKRVLYNKRINKKELFQEISCSLLSLIETLIYKYHKSEFRTDFILHNLSSEGFKIFWRNAFWQYLLEVSM